MPSRQIITAVLLAGTVGMNAGCSGSNHGGAVPSPLVPSAPAQADKISIVIVFDPDELYQEALPSADGSYRLYWQPESYSCCDHYCVYAFAFPGRRNVVYRVSPSWTTATLSTDDGWCVVEPKRSSGIDPQQSFAVSATSVDAAGHSTGLTQETVSVRFVDR